MPPLTRLRIPALADLARQLRFTPTEALARDIDRAEALVGELHPGRAYPLDWIVFRVTGYRPEMGDPPLIVGSALIGDLSALIERLCEAGGMTWEQLARNDPGLVDADALCVRWNVSRKSLDRYRRKGLVARRVRGPGGRPMLAFTSRAIDAFGARNGDLIARASGYSRIDPDVEREMIRRAERYRRRLGLSLNETARRLADRFGRSHEAVRQVLRRHDERAAGEGWGAIFAESGPMSRRQREAIFRCWRRAIEPRLIAGHFGRTSATVNRVIGQRRAQLLRGLDLVAPASASPDRPGADEDLLAADPVRTGLGAPGQTDLLALIESARVQGAPDASVERTRTRAQVVLVHRAARMIEEMSPSAPSPTMLDEIETSLRWAARLRAELVRSQLGLMVNTIEGSIGRPLDRCRPEATRTLVIRCLEAMSGAAGRFDPLHGGRLAAPCGIAVTRVAGDWSREDPGRHSGAKPVLRPGVWIPDWTLRVAPWQGWLEPDARIRGILDRLDPDLRRILIERFGWGGPPQTLARIAAARGRKPMHLARLGRRAIREALRLARQGTPARSGASVAR